MGRYWSKLLGRDDRTPIKGVKPRLRNIAVKNFRGLLGIVVAIVILATTLGQGKALVQCMWLVMAFYFLIQPVTITGTACIPIWVLPMGGALSTAMTAKCYINEGMALFILGSMFILLINNSGFDRRMILSIICSKDASKFSMKRMVWKCSFAAFILSMFSNKLVVTTIILEYVTPIYIDLGVYYAKSLTEPKFQEFGYILNNAIQTSASIGSTAIMYSAYGTLAFRSIWVDSCIGEGLEYPDIFNFLQYSIFAIPLAVVLFIVNLLYHFVLIKCVIGKTMSAATKLEVKNQMLNHKNTIPKTVTCHEKVTVFFTVVGIVLLFTRMSRYGMGWTGYNAVDGKPVIKDCTIVAIFVLFMNLLPRSCNFLRVFTVKKKSETKNFKPESSILFWRFVNKNTIYAYLLLMGSGVAINLATVKTELYVDITKHSGTHITGLGFSVGLLVICIIAVILANIMSGVAALVTFLPFVLNMARTGVAEPWEHQAYLPALGVGIASSFGFMSPFLYTPAYLCHHIGKVPKSKMAKYSFISVILCCIILWVFLLYLGPMFWDPSHKGFQCEKAAVVGQPPADDGDGGGGGGGGDGGGGGGDDRI